LPEPFTVVALHLHRALLGGSAGAAGLLQPGGQLFQESGVARKIIEYGDRLATAAALLQAESDRQVGIKRAVLEGAIPTTYESILFELTRVAKTETFKTISKLIK
jgi:hypothetical protein